MWGNIITQNKCVYNHTDIEKGNLNLRFPLGPLARHIVDLKALLTTA